MARVRRIGFHGLLGGLAACSAPVPPVPGPGPTLTVATYNVNFERFDPTTVDAIVATDADVVFLQETTAQWEEAIRSRLGDPYPTMLFHPSDPDGGMGVLARGDVTVVSRLSSPVGAFPATALEVTTPLGDLRVLHVHLHPPLDENGLLTGYFTTGGKRLAEIEAHLAALGHAPDLLVGDFNEEEGDAVSAIEARGYRDAAAAFPPPVRTWSWNSDYGELEGRPDHVFYGPAFATGEVRVIEQGASDHRPLVATIAHVAP